MNSRARAAPCHATLFCLGLTTACATPTTTATPPLRPADTSAATDGTSSLNPVAPAPSRVGAVLESARAHHGVPALGAAIVRSAGVEVVEVSGVRHRRRGGAVTREELWHLGSDTKAMTATLVAMLVEEADDVSWDAPVTALFAGLDVDVDPAWREITLQMLLDHRGGLPANIDAITSASSRAGMDPRAHRATMIATLLAAPPEGAPGIFAYSNVGYTMLGALLERRWDADFEALMASRLWRPLGMARCGFGGPGEGNARGHVGGVAQGAAFDNPPIIAPAGTAHCSLEAWAAFVGLHLRAARGESELLSAPSFAHLHTPQEGETYAGGWIVVEREGDGRILTHDGSNTAWYAHAVLVPAHDLAVLVTSNAGLPDGQAAVMEAAEAILKLE